MKEVLQRSRKTPERWLFFPCLLAQVKSSYSQAAPFTAHGLCRNCCIYLSLVYSEFRVQRLGNFREDPSWQDANIKHFVGNKMTYFTRNNCVGLVYSENAHTTRRAIFHDENAA